MKQAQLIYITGDVHLKWDWLNRFLEREIRQGATVAKLMAEYDELEILLFVCGDFGYWPHWHGRTVVHRDQTLLWAYYLGQIKEKPEDEVFTYDQYSIENRMDGVKDGHIKIYWCDGNHENHDALAALEAEHPAEDFIPIIPWVFFARFGSVLALLDGTRVMFCGGAQSTDKRSREEGETWWAGEEIDEADMARLPDPEKERVHWVVSHTSPESFKVVDFDLRRSIFQKDRDPSRRHLESVRRRFAPEQWWFGHYHMAQSGMLDGCRWAVLDCLEWHGEGRWFEKRLLTQDPERPAFFQHRGKVGQGATVVFFDTEFSDLDNSELISLGAVSEDGVSEFYAEITPLPERHSDFVRERVLPLLTGPAYPRDEVARRFLQWLKGFGTDILMLSDSDTDRELVEELCAHEAEVHFGDRRCVWQYCSGTGGFGTHHALEDARGLRKQRKKIEAKVTGAQVAALARYVRSECP